MGRLHRMAAPKPQRAPFGRAPGAAARDDLKDPVDPASIAPEGAQSGVAAPRRLWVGRGQKSWHRRPQMPNYASLHSGPAGPPRPGSPEQTLQRMVAEYNAMLLQQRELQASTHATQRQLLQMQQDALEFLRQHWQRRRRRPLLTPRPAIPKAPPRRLPPPPPPPSSSAAPPGLEQLKLTDADINVLLYGGDPPAAAAWTVHGAMTPAAEGSGHPCATAPDGAAGARSAAAGTPSPDGWARASDGSAQTRIGCR